MPWIELSKLQVCRSGTIFHRYNCRFSLLEVANSSRGSLRSTRRTSGRVPHFMARPSAMSKIRLLLSEELKKLDEGLNKLLPLEEIAVWGECSLLEKWCTWTYEIPETYWCQRDHYLVLHPLLLTLWWVAPSAKPPLHWMVTPESAARRCASRNMSQTQLCALLSHETRNSPVIAHEVLKETSEKVYKGWMHLRKAFLHHLCSHGWYDHMTFA